VEIPVHDVREGIEFKTPLLCFYLCPCSFI
jgi:hypothetical protein